MTICAKALVFITINLASPGYDPATIEACFATMHACQVFERVVLQRVTEASDGKIAVRSACRPRQ